MRIQVATLFVMALATACGSDGEAKVETLTIGEATRAIGSAFCRRGIECGARDDKGATFTQSACEDAFKSGVARTGVDESAVSACDRAETSACTSDLASVACGDVLAGKLPGTCQSCH